MLGSEKDGFRLWNYKFINAITQIHKGSRGFFEALTVKLDQARLVIPDEEVTELAERTQWMEHPLDIATLNEDIYFILMDRCPLLCTLFPYSPFLAPHSLSPSPFLPCPSPAY